MLGAARVTRTILALLAPAQQADVSSTRKASKSFPSRGLQTPLRYSIRQQHPGSLREPARLQFTESRRREDQLAESPWLRNSRLDGDSERLKAKCAMRLFLGQGHGTGMGVERTVKQLHGRHSEQGLSLYLRVLFIHLLPAGFRENLCAAARQTVLIQIAFRVGD